MSRQDLQRLRVGALTTSRTAVFVPLSGVPYPRDVDLRSLLLGPLEAYALSLVDGRTTVEEIAAAAALTPAEMHRLLHTLVERGAIDFVEPATSEARLRTPT